MAQSTVASGQNILDRLPWYAQLGIVVGLIVLFVFLVHWFMLRPKWQDADKKIQEAIDLESQNREADLVEQNIKAFEATLEKLNKDLDSLKVKLPDNPETSVVFEDAGRQMVLRNGLKLVKFDTGVKTGAGGGGAKKIEKEYYTEVPMKVQVAGSYANIQALFQQLADYERIVNVTDIILQKAPEQYQAEGATTMAEFTLTPFYMSEKNRQNLEAGPKEEAKGKGKGKAKGKGGEEKDKEKAEKK
jgi:type IV pilus assembly protein PilO